MRSGKRVVSAGCDNTADLTAGIRPAAHVISVAACLIGPAVYVICPAAYLIRPAGCLISTAAYIICPSGQSTPISA